MNQKTWRRASSPREVNRQMSVDVKGTPSLIADQLRDDIFSGRLAGGAVLNQGGLAERFGVSRIPVREALRHLETDGLIIYATNRGAVVADFSVGEILERYEIRCLLEPLALRLSIPNMTASDIRKAKNEHIGMKESKEIRSWGKHHLAFHRALYEPARRPRLLAIIQSLYVNVGAILTVEQARDLMKSDEKDHGLILEACAKGNVGGAVRALDRHLNDSRRVVLEVMRRRNGASQDAIVS